MLEKLLHGKAEVNLLGVVIFIDGLHLREIARKVGISSSEAKRELDILVSAGGGQSREERKPQFVLSGKILSIP